MLHREITKHKYHYSALIIVEAILLSIFVTNKDQLVQLMAAIGVGVLYFCWGVITHAGQIRTPRLMLEYAVVGLMGSLMLIVLLKSV
jgi:hypothetical protein